MPSTFEQWGLGKVRLLWQPVVISTIVIAAALAQSRLTLAGVIFLAVLVASVLIRAVIVARLPVPAVSETVAPVGQKALVMLAFTGMVALPLVWLATPFLDGAAYRLPGWVIAIGALIGLFSQWLFWRAHVDLGANWSAVLEVHDGHQLVTNGIYRYVRHPMYASIFVQIVAQALLIGNWIAGPSGLIAFGILYLVRVGPEERMMAATFGPEWRDYAARTGRIWPRLRRA